MRPLPQLPIYFHWLDVAVPDRKAIYDCMVAQHKEIIYKKSNSFLLKDTPDRVFDRIYHRTLETVKGIFGPLELLPRNSRNCWCYVTNKDHYRNGIHNHMRTSTISAVYYFHVPKTRHYRHGSISFYDDQKRELLCYKPKTGDLIIFPNYLNHEPNACPTEEYRLAVNMEIRCKDVWGRKSVTDEISRPTALAAPNHP